MKENKFISILNATSIHKDGGFRILQKFKKLNFNRIYLDTRITNSFIPPFLYKLYLDFFYLFKFKEKTKILYLSGTPPVVRINALIFCCFQNDNIFIKNKNFVFRLVSKDFFRYLFFQMFKKNVDIWIVFSPYAQNLLLMNNIPKDKIKMVFLFNNITNKKKNYKKKKYDFIYPASLMEHKNHKNLIEALIILSKKKIYPKILLTLNLNEVRNSSFLLLKKKFKLNITFRYYKYNNVNYAYNASKALIFPSLNETIGLPILEAAYNYLPILASNRQYATQFVVPQILFEPTDPKDIAKKIQMFLSNKKKISNKKFKLSKNSDFINFKVAKKIFL
jgi:glycosyltransferase involved in cell wall biosynthesis